MQTLTSLVIIEWISVVWDRESPNKCCSCVTSLSRGSLVPTWLEFWEYGGRYSEFDLLNLTNINYYFSGIVYIGCIRVTAVYILLDQNTQVYFYVEETVEGDALLINADICFYLHQEAKIFLKRCKLCLSWLTL